MYFSSCAFNVQYHGLCLHMPSSQSGELAELACGRLQLRRSARPEPQIPSLPHFIADLRIAAVATFGSTCANNNVQLTLNVGCMETSTAVVVVPGGTSTTTT